MYMRIALGRVGITSGSFATFQDPRIAPVGQLFDQSENNSEKLGTRLTYARGSLAGAPLDLVTGFDFRGDAAYQRYIARADGNRARIECRIASRDHVRIQHFRGS